MSPDKKNKDRFLTSIIIVVAILGIFYFGYRAIIENSSSNQENPFEYNIENFKKSDSSLFHYTQTGQIDIDLNNVYAIAVGTENQLCVAGDQVIQILDEKGNIKNSINSGQPVRALSMDPNSDIYAAKENKIEIYDTKGQQKQSWNLPGEKALSTSIFATENFVYVADAGNHIVYKYDRAGNLLKQIGEKNQQKEIPGFIIPSPYFDLSVDPDGFLWVVNPGRHSLENYTEDGDLRSFWGVFSMNMEGFCGCCNPTHITIMNDGSFVTSEKGIPRVKVYNRLGNLISVVAGPDQFDDNTVGLDLAIDSSNRIYVLDPKKKAVRIFKKKI